MALSTWWASDQVPAYPAMPGFQAGPASELHTLARVNGLTVDEILSRCRDGHRPYLAWYEEEPAAYGWVACHSASIGELDLTFRLPVGHRYLWDFGTLPEYRGRGVYPRLLQTILAREAEQADAFWIIHALENLPSGAGIEKAGFTPVGQLSFTLDGGVGLQPYDDLHRAQVGAILLGVELIDTILSPCWCCGSVSEQHCGPKEAEACWPPIRPDTAGICTCAIPTRSGADLYATQSQKRR
jgi:GNAT superfamily N-acetyltransferase